MPQIILVLSPELDKFYRAEARKIEEQSYSNFTKVDLIIKILEDYKKQKNG